MRTPPVPSNRPTRKRRTARINNRLEEHEVTVLPPRTISSFSERVINAGIFRHLFSRSPTPAERIIAQQQQQTTTEEIPGAFAIQPGNIEPQRLTPAPVPRQHQQRRRTNNDAAAEEKQSEDYYHDNEAATTAVAAQEEEPIVAELVTESGRLEQEEQVRALNELVTDSSRQQQQQVTALKKWIVFLVILFILLLIALGGAVGGLISRFNSNSSPVSLVPVTNSPTTPPSELPTTFPSVQPSASFDPSQAPVTEFQVELISLIQPQSPTTLFQNTTSPGAEGGLILRFNNSSPVSLFPVTSSPTTPPSELPTTFPSFQPSATLDPSQAPSTAFQAESFH